VLVPLKSQRFRRFFIWFCVQRIKGPALQSGLLSFLRENDGQPIVLGRIAMHGTRMGGSKPCGLCPLVLARQTRFAGGIVFRVRLL
jgi:hypothetical protein